MWFLTLVMYIGLLIPFTVIIVAMASGLYLIAELNTEMIKIILQYLTYVVLALYGGLIVFEELPYSVIFCGIISHIIHLVILVDFPYITTNSCPYIAAIVLFLVNNYFALTHFLSIFIPFPEVLCFFIVCIWMIPFSLFFSLSPDLNPLPIDFFSRESWNPHPPPLLETLRRCGLLTFLLYCKERMFYRKNNK